MVNNKGIIELSAAMILRLIMGSAILIIIISFFARIPLLSEQTILGKLILIMSLFAITQAIIDMLKNTVIG